MNPPPPTDTLTVLYDGACPLCRREIAHLRGLAQRQGDSGLCFVDLSAHGDGDGDDAGVGDGDGGRAAVGNAAGAGPLAAAERATLLARFHVQRADGSRLHGAAAFVEMWSRLPGWRWLARAARLPGALLLLEWAYRGFLRLRPALQALARRRQSTGKRA